MKLFQKVATETTKNYKKVMLCRYDLNEKSLYLNNLLQRKFKEIEQNMH
jgi:hypothetical protein